MDESKHVLGQCLLMDSTNLLLPEQHNIKNKQGFCNHGRLSLAFVITRCLAKSNNCFIIQDIRTFSQLKCQPRSQGLLLACRRHIRKPKDPGN